MSVAELRASVEERIQSDTISRRTKVESSRRGVYQLGFHGGTEDVLYGDCSSGRPCALITYCSSLEQDVSSSVTCSHSPVIDDDTEHSQLSHSLYVQTCWQ